MKIVITGGLGFIGSSFVNLLRQERPNAEILIVDKVTYAANPISSLGENLLRKDICDVTVEDLGEYDYLINFAAESHVDNSIKNGKPFVRTNVEGTFNLLECARHNNKLKKFIHISTDEVYGDMDVNGYGNTVAKEDTPLKGSSYYSATKAGSDLLIESANRTFGLPYIITRTCNNFGLHQHNEKFLPTIQKSIREDKEIPVYGDGKQQREWIHVEDNVKAILLLMFSPHSGVWNIGSGDRWTNIDIVKEIGKNLNKDIKYKYVKDRLGHDRTYAINSLRFRNAFPQWECKLTLEQYLKYII